MLVKIVCKKCGKVFQVGHWRKNKAKFCSRSCDMSHRLTGKFGEEHPSYKNGIGRGHQNRFIEKSIELFGFNCQECGNNGFIDLHHIDNDPRNNPLDGSNWKRLCKSCHSTLHWKPHKKFNNTKERNMAYKNSHFLNKISLFQNKMLKIFGTKDFLRTTDLSKKLNLSRERIRQLRNIGKFYYTKVGGIFLYPLKFKKY